MNALVLPASCPPAADPGPPRAVSVWELLHEALHAPAHPCQGGTMTYTSSLLGAPVARDSLLGLADLLAASGSDLEDRCLCLEGHGKEGAVLAETTRRARRFRLGQGYRTGVYQLCQQPGCRLELDRHRTLCDVHMKAAGVPAVEEQTRLVAQGLKADRADADDDGSASMRQLMKAALDVGIPAAAHARYFAERLNLPDTDSEDDWDYDDYEFAIREDEVRLLRYGAGQPRLELAPAGRGAARPVGPLDPLQLPGSPEHLRLDFACMTDGLPPHLPDDLQYWRVRVLHRVQEAVPHPEHDLGQIGRLTLARTGWQQDPSLLHDIADTHVDASAIARAAQEAADDPDSPIHRLGVGKHGDLLLLLNVELDPAWRGFGLGALLTRQALHVLGQGSRLIATGVEDMDSPAGHLVRTAGFHPVGPRLAVLDQSSQDQQAVRLRTLHRDLVISLANPERDRSAPF
ncbi:hypothetical protein StrepF001_12960 [Streptomyces sp. F001]|uniref:hypothetical protein n=1 Tax=Streptomyces sp. F001 TaxID=1510026 RepID=UPI00101E5382|nr:hypothetical protein [Streptomyces sp. F001]RZB19629.1 hypothetical protein StrepF001_12960 [Streptomyces sp. F001]